MSIIKNLLAALLLFLSTHLQAQNGKIYLLIDDGLAIQEHKEVMDGFFECTLTVNSAKSTDTYAFTLHGDGTKGLDDFGQEIDLNSLEILDKEKLKKLSPCDLHEQLSDKYTIFVKPDAKTGKYKAWQPMYVSTSKNRTVIKQKNKI